MFKPGDLVMVVKPTECCGNSTAVGRIGTVEGPSKKYVNCGYCGDRRLADGDVVVGSGAFYPSRLRKIDPLTEQDKTETLQEITA